MKICVSSAGREKSSPVDPRFGRCSYFVICDSEANLYHAVPNNGLTSPHGAGVAAAQQIIDEKADVVVTGNIGPNAMELIQAAGMIIYEISDGTVERAVELCRNDKLDKISQPVPAHSGINSQGR